MEIRCLYCGSKFSAKRITAKFCSEAHRQAYNRLPSPEGIAPALEPFKNKPHADRLHGVTQLSQKAEELLRLLVDEFGGIAGQKALEIAWYVAFAYEQQTARDTASRLALLDSFTKADAALWEKIRKLQEENRVLKIDKEALLKGFENLNTGTPGSAAPATIPAPPAPTPLKILPAPEPTGFVRADELQNYVQRPLNPASKEKAWAAYKLFTIDDYGGESVFKADFNDGEVEEMFWRDNRAEFEKDCLENPDFIRRLMDQYHVEINGLPTGDV